MRRYVPIVALALALLPATAHAAPAIPGIDLSGIGERFTESLFEGLGIWIEDYLGNAGPLVIVRAFLTGLGWMGQQLIRGISESSRVQGVDLLTQLSPEVTLDDPTVRRVADTAKGLFNGIIGAGLVFMAFTVLLSFGGVRGAEVAQLLPRIALGAVGINMVNDVLRAGMNLSNGIGMHLGGQGAGSFTGLVAGQINPADSGGMVLAMGIMAALLFVQRIIMHGLIDLLAMVAPLAIAAWVVPQWSQWFWKWTGMVRAVLIGGALQTMALAAGASMLARAVSVTGDGGAREMLMGAISVGFMGLAIGLPSMVGMGLVGGSLIGYAMRVTRNVNLRSKSRTAPQTTGTDTAPAVDPGEEYDHRYGGNLSGQERSRPRTIIYTELPSLPPASGNVVTRKQLPPPDYTKE